MDESEINAFDAVAEAEKKHIHQSSQKTNTDYRGLAFSGGGIRSASFCLGIMQALVRGGMLKKMDYLSTASGGGYIGSCLTWMLHNKLPDGRGSGTEIDNFPFGQIGAGSRNRTHNHNAALDFIRQHGNYLAPGHGLDIIAFLGYLLRTCLTSILVYTALFTLILMGLLSSEILFTPSMIPDMVHADDTPIRVPNMLLLAALILVSFFVASGLLYSLASRFIGRRGSLSYKFRIYNQIAIGIFIKFAFACLILGSLPVVHSELLNLKMHIQTAGLSTMLGAGIGWYRYYSQLNQGAHNGQKSSGKFTPILASSLIIYGLLLGAYSLAVIVRDLSGTDFLLALVALSITAVLIGFLTNINYSSAHRMYRDRLMEAFLPDAKNIKEGEWGPASSADSALLEDMCGGDNQRPYQLINTNLVLVNSKDAKYRIRGGDSFVLSPLFCGSYATGWCSTAQYMKRGGRGMTLASAMAISGAALNPNTASNGRGASRNRWVSILFTLLNLRLGYWAANPKYPKSRFNTPNFFNPGLTQSVLGNGLHEDTNLVELSDGGHFDNLAVYELIRRKLDVIIACDGGSDPNYTFDDLANLIERVRVDFGVKIAFEDPEYNLNWLMPDSEESDNNFFRQFQPAKRGFAVANIYYADGTQGKLIYIKATLTGNLAADLYSYKASHPQYPHEATTDQFFDEVQIEAYRELGYYLGWQMLEANSKVKSGEKVNPEDMAIFA